MKKFLAFMLVFAMVLSMSLAVSADEWSINCSDGFGAARSEALPISTEISSWSFVSTTDADAVNNWDSAIVEVNAGSVWAMTLRSDAFGWGGDGYQLSTTANLPADWAAWLEANKAGVACTVTAQIVEAEDSNYIVVGVSNNGVIGVYTFPTTETTGSIVLTGENCVLTGLTASADHIDMSEAIAKVTAPKAAITPDPSAIDTVGSTDLTLGFFGDVSTSYELPEGATATVKLNNYSSGNANFHNFILGFSTAPHGGEGYAEYAIIRADAFGWGDASYVGAFNCSWTDWAAWLNLMKDAEVTLSITRAGSQLTVDMTFVGADGTVMTEQAVITSSLTAEAPCYFFLTGEACYVELLSVSGIPGVEEEPDETPDSEWVVDCPAWWGGHSAPVVITEERQSWKFTSTTYETAADNWDTATAVIWRSDDGTMGGAGYLEELLIRSDSWAVSEERYWGSPKGQLTWSVKNYPADWTEWLNANKAGAEVIVTAQLVDGYIVVGYSNNGVFNVYSVPMNADSTSPVYLSITGEECTLTGWTATDEHLPIDDAVAAPADPTNPETGDSTAIYFVAMACVLSLAALVFVSKKRFAI